MPSRFRASLLLVFLGASVFAVQTQFLRISTMREFLEGDLDGLSVDSSGRLSLAPATRPGPDLGAPAAWAIAADARGTLYVGTGNNGRILEVENQTLRTFHDAPEPEVQALAIGPDGRLFAATNPDGKVYAIDRVGKSVVYFDPEERYIWALAFDGQGRLWVATGGEGRIYRVDASGQGRSILTSQDAHVTSLAIAPGGGVFAGTSPSGLVYEVDARDNVRVIYDSNFREVKAILPGANGSIYVALVNGRSDPPAPRPSPSPSAAPVATPAAEVTASTSIEVFAFPSRPMVEAPRGGTRPPRGAIVLITSVGDADQLWSGDESPFFLFRRDQDVLFGSGSNGHIYEVHPDRTYALLTSMPQDQLTAAVSIPGGDMAIASSNPGKLQYLSSRRGSRGTFTSKAMDFDNVSRVGALEAGTSSPATAFEIRTGNAEVPDTTWSAWEKVAPGRAPASSPQARFAQIRATLTGASEGPSLLWLQLAYVQRNLGPVIVDLTLHPAGNAFQRNPGGNGDDDIAGLATGAPEIKATETPRGKSTDAANLGRKVFFRSLRTVTWRAEDENGDTLRYDVSYRPEGSTTFKRLREGLEEPVFTWDTATVPSGRYVLRVIARDQTSNPEGRGLSYQQDTEVFDVDNEPPVITATVNGSQVKVTVTDSISAVRKAEWAIEAGSWRDMTPLDGIADSRGEQFELRLDAPASAIVVRATDAFGNVALARVAVGAGIRN